MDIVEYAEHICGAKLYDWQRTYLRGLERLRHQGDIRIVMDRCGRLFVYINPKELLSDGQTTTIEQ